MIDELMIDELMIDTGIGDRKFWTMVVCIAYDCAYVIHSVYMEIPFFDSKINLMKENAEKQFSSGTTLSTINERCLKYASRENSMYAQKKTFIGPRSRSRSRKRR